MSKPTMADAKQLHARLCAVPTMPHRGPSRERRTILLEALGQTYVAGLEAAELEALRIRDRNQLKSLWDIGEKIAKAIRALNEKKG